MSDVFISYSHTDSDVADKIAKILDKLGIPYFRDVKEIQWGDKLSERVHHGLREASALIVIISPGSRKSEWVPFEVGFATGRGIRLLPFLTHPSIDVPTYLSDLTYAKDFDQVKEYFSNWTPPTPTAEALERGLQIEIDPAFCRIAEMMPELIEEMRKDISGPENKFVREFVPLANERVRFNHSKPRFSYYEDVHEDLLNKISMLEAAGFVHEVHRSPHGTCIYRMTEEFVTNILKWQTTSPATARTIELRSQHGPAYNKKVPSFDALINHYLALGWQILQTYTEGKSQESQECVCLLAWTKVEPPIYPDLSDDSESLPD